MLILRTPRRKKGSQWEARLARAIEFERLPVPVREYRFHPTRQWRFDFAWPAEKLAAECEGAVFGRGRHTRGAGFTEDCAKYNAAVLLGWRVLRFTEPQIKDYSAVRVIREALGLHDEPTIEVSNCQVLQRAQEEP